MDEVRDSCGPCTIPPQIDESEVKAVLNNEYPVAQRRKEMLAKKRTTPTEANEWELLVREMVQVVQTKQLVLTMRRQYMRTAS